MFDFRVGYGTGQMKCYNAAEILKLVTKNLYIECYILIFYNNYTTLKHLIIYILK